MSDLLGGSQYVRPPLGVRLPETIPTFLRKWQDPALRQLPEHIRAPVMEIDYDRVRRGAQPMGQRETVSALRGALGEESPEAERTGIPGLISNLQSDVVGVASSIFKVPGLAAREILSESKHTIPEVTEGLGEIATGDVSEGVEQISRAPLVRMLPGAFWAEALSSDPGLLYEHPLMAGLDVLPFVSAGVGKIPRVAQRAQETQKGTLRAGASELIGKPAGDLVERLTGTRPGTYLDRAGFGPGTQDIAIRVAQAGRMSERRLHAFANSVDDMFRRHNVVDPEHQAEFSRIISRGDPEDLANLSPNEQALRSEIIDVLDKMNIEHNYGDKPRMFRFRGEEFPMTPAQGMTLKSLSTRLGKDRYKPEAFERLNKLIEKDQPIAQLGDEAARTIEQRGYRPPDEIQNEVVRGLAENPIDLSIYREVAQPGWQGRGRIENQLRETVERGIQPLSDQTVVNEAAAAKRALDRVRRLGDGATGHDLYKALHPSFKQFSDETLGRFADEFGVEIGRRIEARKSRMPTPTEYQNIIPKAEQRLARVFGDEKSHFAMAAKYLEKGRLNRAGRRLERAVEDIARAADIAPYLRFANDRYVRQLADDARSLTSHAQARVGEKAAARIAKRQELVDRRIREIDSMQKKLEDVYSRSVPGRFMDIIQERFRERLRTIAEGKNVDLTEEAFADIMRHVDEGFYDVAGLSRGEMAATWREVAREWVKIKEAGFDPVYRHSVDIGQAASLRFPRVFPERISNPTQWKAKSMDAKPSIENFSVALKHQELEFLRHDLGQQVIQGIQEKYGATRPDLVRQYEPNVRPELMPPGVNVRGLVEKEMAREWVKWDETGLIPLQKARATLAPSQDVYIPRWVADTIRKMYPDRKVGLAAAWDKATDIFRISILPFAPRWHIYNALGGATMLTARTGLGVIGEYSEAMKMVKATRDGIIEGSMPVEIARGMGSVPREVASYQYAAGATQGRLLREMWDSDATTTAGRIGETGRRTVEKLFDMNTFVDDLYRSMAYLYGKKSALRKGMSDTQAHTAGVELANKVLQNWDAMTPVERSILRNVFPFYGWMKHILAYTGTLPIDHPIRMSVISNFARNEIEDYGLPQRFYSMFFLGKPDVYGNVTGISFRGSNPFSDVANYMSLAGFINMMNPMIGGFLQSMGVDAISGKADLYPDLVYNGISGRVEAKTPNPLQSIAFSLVPQAEGLLAGLDALGVGDLPLINTFGLTTDEMRVLKQNNPEAFRARIASSLGIPPIPRTVNVTKEAALAELSRDRAARDALRKALRSGSWAEARRYPANRPILDRLDEYLQAGLLDEFILPEPSYIRE